MHYTPLYHSVFIVVYCNIDHKVIGNGIKYLDENGKEMSSGSSQRVYKLGDGRSIIFKIFLFFILNKGNKIEVDLFW